MPNGRNGVCALAMWWCCRTVCMFVVRRNSEAQPQSMQRTACDHRVWWNAGTGKCL